MTKFKEKFENIMDKISLAVTGFIKKYDIWIYFGIISILAIVIRVVLFDRISGDYSSFLKPWYKNYLTNGFAALGSQSGDYTPAYNYFLWFLSIFKFDPESKNVLYGIKIYSCLYDIGLAVFAGLIAYKLTDKDKIKTLLAYTLTIMGITVVLNSSWWAQCDSIYAFFILGSIYFFLGKRERTSMILLGCAFCYKVQTIFVLPVFIIAWLRRDMKFRYILWIPIVYTLMSIPACIAAGSNFFSRLAQCYSVFFNQAANSYTQLSLNAGTLYTVIFTNFKSEGSISKFSLPFAIAVIGTFIFTQYRSKEEITKKKYFELFAFYSLLMPFVLPHMHERYYYISEILLPLYAILNPKKFYVAIMAFINSMIGYMVYLWNVPFINVVPQDGSITDSTKALSFRFGGLLCLAAICIIAVGIYQGLYPKDKKENTTKQVY